ncbi:MULTISPECIES: tetratricopeptide repeat protein [Tenacibaculum]|uniref:tetratricopeptide repeat protein n=1 Tax=Tenacibaculum TaxID=104267 RepID=UPI001F0AEA2A|nr:MULTISPECIES: tetratricopeptide repeat protein [Tenacibaculum]MCH3882516.1 tetratricopeptide repeat protein [Tenacibaculum aquimarinum]MCH3885692.1 tetratricopeptide repeat protein [Tenacibaculum aquimarinum]MDO6599998.1 tetratricopeptide repeat protein [Tenacibaculum sp. 1_MG-2023]
MKKQILALTLGLMTVGAMAQKNELKAAEKAIKKNDFSTAVTAVTAAEALMSNMDAKSKAKFYFLKGKAFAGKKDYKNAADAFNNLMKHEKATGKARYTKEAAPMLGVLKDEVQQKAFSFYESKDYKGASDTFYLRYLLEEKDTMFLSNSAQLALQGKDYDNALKYYSKLKDLGYTGIETQFLATNKESGKVENLGSKQQRDLMVKTGKYIKPEDKRTKSKKVDIIKNIALILKEQGKTDEAINAFKEARASDPDDIQLLLAEAYMYNDLKQMDKFSSLLKEATEKDPTNPDLYFNIGIVNYNEKRGEEAQKYFLKALELKTDYPKAHLMLATSMLQKDDIIVKKMNDLPPSDMASYTKLENERKVLYTEIIPVLTKADELERTIDTVRLLMNLHESLENEAKASEFRALYKAMK